MNPGMLLLVTLGVPVALDPVPRPLVLTIAGIGVGTKSTDADVVRKFGKGCFDPAVPHGGARYFTNAAGSLTLQTIIGVDDSTEVIELREGRHVPKSCAGDPVSQALARPPLIDQAIYIGMRSAQVRRILGKSDRVKSVGDGNALIYRASYEEDERVSLFYEASFVFRNDRLVAISIADGE